MTKYHDPRRKPRKVSEPVQVYLEAPDQQRLAWLASQLGTTKSGVLRRGLEALERELADPAAHPALSVIGLAQDDEATDHDVAREHDRFLADLEDRGNVPPRAKKRRAR